MVAKPALIGDAATARTSPLTIGLCASRGYDSPAHGEREPPSRRSTLARERGVESYRGLLGILVLMTIAWALSHDRRRIPLRVVLSCLALQALIAWLFLAFPPVVAAVNAFALFVTRVISFADEGSRFIFGELANSNGPWGFVFAVRALPSIIFFAALMSILYHLGVMQRVIAALAWVLRRAAGVTGAEALVTAANVFLGQTEAPLAVRPLIPRMTKSQIMVLMTTGFASIAGSVLGAYIAILGGEDMEQRALFAKHLLNASLMSAPAALLYAKIMAPELETPPNESVYDLSQERRTRNVLDAAALGASDGLSLALNVGAMLVAFVALLALLNWPLQALGEIAPVRSWVEQAGLQTLSLQSILGWILTPLAWVLGVSWADSTTYGALLGEQLIATEFKAYLSLGELIRSPSAALDERTAQMASYALCGFANFPSIAIQIGGLTAMAPGRRADFASIGLRAMLAGAFACWTTSAIAGMFL